MSKIKFNLLFPKPPKILNVNYYDFILKNEKKLNDSLKFNFNNFYRKPRIKPLIPIFDKNFNQINNDEKVIYYYNSNNDFFINKNKKFSILNHHKKSFSNNHIQNNKIFNNINIKKKKNIKLIFNNNNFSNKFNNFSINSNNNLPSIQNEKNKTDFHSNKINLKLNNMKKNFLFKKLINKREFSV